MPNAMTRYLLSVVFGGVILAGGAQAQGFLTSANGLVSIGVNRTGELIIAAAPIGGPKTQATGLGLAYNFSGQGGRTGWQDALAPGCDCESWGVAGNGLGNQVGQHTGNLGINFVSQAFMPNASFTSVTTAAASGLRITHTFTEAVSTTTGALFRAAVTIENPTATAITNVRYARAMDWDIAPTEFREWVTHKGVPTTTTLLHATNNGFALANPMMAVSDLGLHGVAPNTEGLQGPVPRDHGSLFVFSFGDLAPSETYSFDILYGVGADERDALTLLSLVSPELYSLGQSNFEGRRRDDLPTFVFAFRGVGGEVIVPPPPTGVPGPGALGLFGLALAGLALARRRRSA